MNKNKPWNTGKKCPTLSEARKKWWIELKKNPEKLKKHIEKITPSILGSNTGKFGKEASGWKGGSYSTKRDKYIYMWCPEHPNAVKGGKGGGGYVLEHRLVMEKEIGRYLLKGEDVHHKNGDKEDNRIENLMLVIHNKHFEEYGCPKCGFKTFIK